MVDKELLYDKCERVLEELELVRDLDIDDDFYKKPLEQIDENLDYALDWLAHMIDSVEPKY